MSSECDGIKFTIRYKKKQLKSFDKDSWSSWKRLVSLIQIKLLSAFIVFIGEIVPWGLKVEWRKEWALGADIQ